MKKLLLIWIGKTIFFISKTFNLGAGSTWPGHIALEVDPDIFLNLVKQLNQGVILVAGTNGKTTTAKMIGEILGNVRGLGDLRVIRNEAGANLLNGMVSALINASDWRGGINADWAIFETDENTLPQVIKIIKNIKIIILLNLFRDQLDRYGEVDLIADKWRAGFEGLGEFGGKAALIINADDPHLACLGKNLKCSVSYFGLNDRKIFLEKMQHAADSTYCPECGAKLYYDGIFFSHLGIWKCKNCGFGRPKLNLSFWHYPLPGVYNRYNTLAAVLAAKTMGMSDFKIKAALKDFQPAFGRQEELVIGGKKIKILLSKNPAGFNESIRTLKEFPGEQKAILLVLNDRIPDGRDVSWIWDVDFEMLGEIGCFGGIGVSGDRAYDLGLRMKYAGIRDFRVFGELKDAIKIGLEKIQKSETLYILATYSAMLGVRNILGERKIP